MLFHLLLCRLHTHCEVVTMSFDSLTSVGSIAPLNVRLKMVTQFSDGMGSHSKAACGKLEFPQQIRFKFQKKAQKNHLPLDGPLFSKNPVYTIHRIQPKIRTVTCRHFRCSSVIAVCWDFVPKFGSWIYRSDEISTQPWSLSCLLTRRRILVEFQCFQPVLVEKDRFSVASNFLACCLHRVALFPEPEKS
jgi:hypothetical protein